MAISRAFDWNFVKFAFFVRSSYYELLIFYVHLPLNPYTSRDRRWDRHWNLCSTELLLLLLLCSCFFVAVLLLSCCFSVARMAHSATNCANMLKLHAHTNKHDTRSRGAEAFSNYFQCAQLEWRLPWKKESSCHAPFTATARIQRSGTWETWTQVVSCECIFVARQTLSKMCHNGEKDANQNCREIW